MSSGNIEKIFSLGEAICELFTIPTFAHVVVSTNGREKKLCRYMKYIPVIGFSDIYGEIN
jgi:hypothetical protein